MIEKLDPRTKKPLTSEQIALLRQHFRQREKQRLSITDYIPNGSNDGDVFIGATPRSTNDFCSIALVNSASLIKNGWYNQWLGLRSWLLGKMYFSNTVCPTLTNLIPS